MDRFQNISNILNPNPPQGAAIGALRIRIPADATTTYTMLPALAR
jgi:hypothetical protein